MVSEQLGLLLRFADLLLLDRDRNLGVPMPPPGVEERFIGGVANEGVLEAVTGIARGSPAED